MNNPKRDSSDITPAKQSAGHTNSRDDALERQLTSQHGALLGPVLAEAAKKLRAEALARLRDQNARLTVAKEALVAASDLSFQGLYGLAEPSQVGLALLLLFQPGDRRSARNV